MSSNLISWRKIFHPTTVWHISFPFFLFLILLLLYNNYKKSQFYKYRLTTVSHYNMCEHWIMCTIIGINDEVSLQRACQATVMAKILSNIHKASHQYCIVCCVLAALALFCGFISVLSMQLSFLWFDNCEEFLVSTCSAQPNRSPKMDILNDN